MLDTQSLVSTLNAVAPGLQALSAIVVTGLTFVLVRTTNRYVKITAGLLEEAEKSRLAAVREGDRQIAVQEQIRMTTLQPYVRIASATFTNARQQDPTGSIFPLFLR